MSLFQAGFFAFESGPQRRSFGFCHLHSDPPARGSPTETTSPIFEGTGQPPQEEWKGIINYVVAFTLVFQF
jgi:hypothetical protein